ncbi:MAG: hypothetical protein D6E12_15255 [Desulfovibrio sp.]|nr:MAG: hypothetical protein D6E12_15255 [Desulfovibrio sp.]
MVLVKVEYSTINYGENEMANCHEMQPGDVLYCNSCGLTLKVEKSCTCAPGKEGSCTVPLSCCGKEMVKQS